MKKVVRMDGFDKLGFEKQLEVLNNSDNFIGLTKVANTSKGEKTYEERIIYKKGGILVNPVFRSDMMRREKEMEVKLQNQIYNLGRKDKK